MARYRFARWEDELGNVWTTPSITLLIDRDKTLTAYYEEVYVPPTYILMVETTVGGTTDPPPGSHVYDEGAIITVTAYADVGYVFDHWEFDGVDRTENPITVTMDADHTLRAVFAEVPPLEYILSITTTAGGTTDPSPGEYPYVEGSSVVVTAIPASRYKFDHWLLDTVVRTENPITVLMDSDHTLQAVFSEVPPPPPPTYNLTILSGAGGTTDPPPDTYTYDAGTTVIVTAIPVADYVFDHWELDGVTYTTSPLSVLMDSNHSLIAFFSEIPPPPPITYNLNISTTAGGTTDPDPGLYTHDVGTVVTVTAIPENGYYFNHWELNGEERTGNPINVLMDKDHLLVAVFSEVPPPPPRFPRLRKWFPRLFERMDEIRRRLGA